MAVHEATSLDLQRTSVGLLAAQAILLPFIITTDTRSIYRWFLLLTYWSFAFLQAAGLFCRYQSYKHWFAIVRSQVAFASSFELIVLHRIYSMSWNRGRAIFLSRLYNCRTPWPSQPSTLWHTWAEVFVDLTTLIVKVVGFGLGVDRIVQWSICIDQWKALFLQGYCAFGMFNLGDIGSQPTGLPLRQGLTFAISCIRYLLSISWTTAVITNTLEQKVNRELEWMVTSVLVSLPSIFTLTQLVRLASGQYEPVFLSSAQTYFTKILRLLASVRSTQPPTPADVEHIVLEDHPASAHGTQELETTSVENLSGIPHWQNV